jgi:hypothetical protein
MGQSSMLRVLHIPPISMTRAAVLKKAQAKWGTRAITEYRKNAPEKSERERALAELARLRSLGPFRGMGRAMRDLESVAYATPRCSILTKGNDLGPFSTTWERGSGDTWDEAARKAGLA